MKEGEKALATHRDLLLKLLHQRSALRRVALAHEEEPLEAGVLPPQRRAELGLSPLLRLQALQLPLHRRLWIVCACACVRVHGRACASVSATGLAIRHRQPRLKQTRKRSPIR